MAERIESFRIRINGVDEEINSIDKLNKANAALRKEIKLMSFDTKDYEKIVKEKNSIIDKNTEIIKKNSDSLVKQKMNIGNYKSALEGLPGPLGRAASGVQALGKQLLLLIANPIILVITAIVGALAILYKAFKSTDSGATELQVRMEQVKAIIDRIRVNVIELTKWIVHQVKAFQEWRKEFAENHKIITKVIDITTTLAIPIKQLIFLVTQLKKLFPKLFEGGKEEFDKITLSARKYVEALDKLEDAEANYVSESAERRNKIAKLESIAADRNNSPEIGIAALKEAIRLGEEELKVQMGFAQKRYEIEAEYLAERNGLKKEEVIAFVKMTDEEQANASESLKTLRNNNEEKFKELDILDGKITDLNTSFYEENKRNVSRLSGFEKAAQNKKAKDREEFLKAELEAIKYRYELLKDAEKEFNEAYYDENDARLEDLQKTIEAEIKLFEEGNKAKEEVKKTDFENSLMLNELQISDEYELKKQQIENDRAMELAEAEKTGADRSIIEAKYAQISANIERERIMERINILSQFTEQAGELLGSFISGQEADFKSLAKSTITAMLDQLKAIILIARVKITAQSLAQPDSVATFGASGVIRAAIINGLISAAFGVVKAAVNKFAFGGRVPGQSRTGDNVPVLVNSGEVILNENQQSRLGGAETFRRIGVPGFAGGGVVPRPSVPVNDMFSMRELAKLINDKKVTLSLSDLETSQGQLSIIKGSGL